MRKLNPELTKKILELLRKNKYQKEIANILGKHRNTISRYVNYIRRNQVHEDIYVINKIDDVLEDRLEEMTTPQLINYRKALSPQKIEQKVKAEVEAKLIVKMWEE